MCLGNNVQKLSIIFFTVLKQNFYCIAAASATVQNVQFQNIVNDLWAVLTVNKCNATSNATIFLYTFFFCEAATDRWAAPLQSFVSCIVVVVLTTTSCIWCDYCFAASTASQDGIMFSRFSTLQEQEDLVELSHNICCCLHGRGPPHREHLCNPFHKLLACVVTGGVRGEFAQTYFQGDTFAHVFCI